MRYGAVERLGLDYATLSKEFPRLIYCHTRGFEKGPRMGHPGNDQTGACLAGIQHEDGAVGKGGKPIWSLTSLGDTGNGFLSAIGIMNALMERERTGKGQFVDTSIVNACLLNTSYAVATPEGKAVDRPRIDKMQTGFSPYYRLYETADGWVQVAAVTEAARAAFDAATGGDPEARAREQNAAAWVAALAAAGVDAEVSDDKASLTLFDNGLYRERGWTVVNQDKAVGKLEQVGHTFTLSETPGVFQGPPIVVGADSAEILTEMGYSDAEIDDLFANFAIGCNPKRAGFEHIKGPWEQ
jgi:crotonobetainyl-CoA:carnitine CoA-transferase CaiB-like acyl-CoA transferase